MKCGHLQAIRSRVERLAQACGTADAETLLNHRGNPYNKCSGCGYDVDAHAQAQAVADAQREDGPEATRKIIVYWWPMTLKVCPECGAELPYSLKDA